MDKLMAKAKILIVDDSPQIVDILVQALSQYTCRIALNGENALKIAMSDFKPDLILLDINLPDMSGFDVIKVLKDEPKTKDIPVIFLTGANNLENQIKGFELGGVDYISKPICIPVLLARVKNHLELYFAKEKLKEQNKQLKLMSQLREEIEKITQHDMKSPLTVIMAFSKMLTDYGNLDERNFRMAQKINTAGQRLLQMINNSLDLYKLEIGHYQTKFEKIDIIPIIKSVSDEFNSVYKTKNINISLFLDDLPVTNNAPLYVSGENHLFYILFSNLIKNAIEASPPNETISINLYSTNPVTISIHNQGTVPHEIRNRFFEKLVTQGKQKGTGLGTYSAKLITLNLLGQIEMQTSDPEGTTILLKFPTKK